MGSLLFVSSGTSKCDQGGSHEHRCGYRERYEQRGGLMGDEVKRGPVVHGASIVPGGG